MERAKPMKTPMHASNPLSRDESGKPIDYMIYGGMIGSILYMFIAYSVCLCARFQF